MNYYIITEIDKVKQYLCEYTTAKTGYIAPKKLSTDITKALCFDKKQVNAVYDKLGIGYAIERSTNMKKYFEVELIANLEGELIENFTMYRMYNNYTEAVIQAKILSKFFPYYQYPTKVNVYQYEVIEGTLCNKKTVNTFQLVDENGKIVT